MVRFSSDFDPDGGLLTGQDKSFSVTLDPVGPVDREQFGFLGQVFAGGVRAVGTFFPDFRALRSVLSDNNGMS